MFKKYRHKESGEEFDIIEDGNWIILSCLTNAKLPSSFFNPTISFSIKRKEFNNNYEPIEE